MRQAALFYLAMLFLLALTGYTYFFHLTEQISVSGFSVIETMAHTLLPENFARDFPSGNASGGSRALLPLLYAPVHALTGVSGLSLLTFMIGVEILCVIGAAWVLWSALAQPGQDTQTRMLRLGLFCWLATMLIAGQVVRPNLSNFGYPFFHGQFYGFAEATSFVAVASFIRRRWLWVAAILCLGFMIHPIKTLMTAMFIAGASLIGGRKEIAVPQLIAGLVVAVFAALWGYFWLGMGQVSGIPPIPDAQYIAYTRAWQYHWYPFDRGILAESQHGYLSPFLAMLLVGALALLKSGMTKKLCRQLVGGFLMLGLLAVAGLWFSYTHTSVFMIKMALIRASELMTMLVPFLVVRAIYQQWQHNAWGWVIFFNGFVLGGMVNTANLSIGIAGLAVGMYFLQERRHRLLFAGENRATDYSLALVASAFLLLTLVIWLAYPGAKLPLQPAWYSAKFLAVAWIIIASPLPRLMAKWAKRAPSYISWLLMSLAFFVLAGLCLHKLYFMDAERLAQARDYYQVQMWARNNTPANALFMVDPCAAYGWREFSERSSIGTPVEWFHTGWLYVSDGRVFERGQAISRTLGLDFADQLPAPGERAELINYKVCQQAQTLYYDPSLAPVRRMALEQNVDYFVMDRTRTDPLMRNHDISPRFANAHYLVFARTDLLP